MTPVLLDNPDAIPSLDTIEEEVRAGLKRDAERMDSALMAQRFYEGLNEQYIERRPAETDDDFKARPKRTSKITRKVIRSLSGQLWGNAPTRQVEGDETLTEWWSGIITDTGLNSRLLAADRSSMLGHAAAIEIEATGDPERPARLYVWRPHEFAVWVRDDDAETVWAICTRSAVPVGIGKQRMRYRVWTAFERRTWYSKPYAFGDPAAGRRADIYAPEESGASPYPGVLPFTLIHFDPAVSEFWSGGLGPMLVDMNQEVDRAMCDLAQHVQRHLNPFGYVLNLPESVSRLVHRVGEFAVLPTNNSAIAAGGNGVPQLGYVQAQLAVEQAWFDIERHINGVLEELDIPAVAVRNLDSRTDLSGVAIVAKQMPYLEQARARQPFATETEVDLFARTCAVVGTYHEQGDLIAAARDPKLIVTWPEVKLPLPTPERNVADQWELDAGLTDPIEVLARRRGITLDQAEELAEQIAERRKEWMALMKPEMEAQQAQQQQGEPGMAQKEAPEEPGGGVKGGEEED